MFFKEPKVEFISLELEDVIATSSPTGPEIHICGGESYDDECDPGNAGSL